MILCVNLDRFTEEQSVLWLIWTGITTILISVGIKYARFNGFHSTLRLRLRLVCETKQPSLNLPAMLSLPVELQEQILDYLSRQDILSLAQTCKSLDFVASIRLRAIIPELDSATFTRCVRVLMENPARAAEILEFNIAKWELKEVRRASPPPPPRHSFIATLKASILRPRSPPSTILTNKHNDVSYNPMIPHHSPLGPLEFSKAFTNSTRLRKLIIHAPQSPLLWMIPFVIVTLREIYAHIGAESTPILCWISYQPHINTLRVHCNGNKLREYRVSPTTSIFFPSLSLLTTNLEGASVLLPESAVEDLHIEGLKQDKQNPWTPEDVGRQQRTSLIRAIGESHERTPLHRLTLTGDVIGIFKCVKALAEGGIFLSHIRIILSDESTESIRILVRLKGPKVLLDSHLPPQEVELSCRRCDIIVIASRNSRSFQWEPRPATFCYQTRHSGPLLWHGKEQIVDVGKGVSMFACYQVSLFTMAY
jgi:F-box-like